jgi:hypothetical protein
MEYLGGLISGIVLAGVGMYIYFDAKIFNLKCNHLLEKIEMMGTMLDIHSDHLDAIDRINKIRGNG